MPKRTIPTWQVKGLKQQNGNTNKQNVQQEIRGNIQQQNEKNGAGTVGSTSMIQQASNTPAQIQSPHHKQQNTRGKAVAKNDEEPIGSYSVPIKNGFQTLHIGDHYLMPPDEGGGPHNT